MDLIKLHLRKNSHFAKHQKHKNKTENGFNFKIWSKSRKKLIIWPKLLIPLMKIHIKNILFLYQFVRTLTLNIMPSFSVAH